MITIIIASLGIFRLYNIIIYYALHWWWCSCNSLRICISQHTVLLHLTTFDHAWFACYVQYLAIYATRFVIWGLIHAQFQVSLPRPCIRHGYNSSCVYHCQKFNGMLEAVEGMLLVRPHSRTCLTYTMMGTRVDYNLNDCNLHGQADSRHVGIDVRIAIFGDLWYWVYS